MKRWPEIETSLIRGLGDPQNHQAWHAFDTLYRPIVRRYASSRGLSAADAEELAADVIRRVGVAARRWSVRRPPEHFGAWLQRVSQNALLNLVTRELSRRGTGGTSNLRKLAERPGPTTGEHEHWERQRQQALLQRAARTMRQRFDAATCDAFWQTHVEGRPPQQVAVDLGKSVGAIYAIRSRTVRWLRDEVRRLEALETGDA